jgi:phosphoribosylformylglycinamidine synthase PurS subunit
MAKVKVHVFLKPGVLDVQGKAVEGALQGLGWAGVANARVGKLIEFDLDGAEDPPPRRKDVRDPARQYGDRKLPDRSRLRRSVVRRCAKPTAAA